MGGQKVKWKITSKQIRFHTQKEKNKNVSSRLSSNLVSTIPCRFSVSMPLSLLQSVKGTEYGTLSHAHHSHMNRCHLPPACLLHNNHKHSTISITWSTKQFRHSPPPPPPPPPTHTHTLLADLHLVLSLCLILSNDVDKDLIVKEA